MNIKRKVLIVSVYYMGDEPRVSHSDQDYEVQDAIHSKLKHGNPDAELMDVIVEEARPWIFSMRRPIFFSAWLYRTLIGR